MKKKIILNKKMILQKEIVASLTDAQQYHVNGGAPQTRYLTAHTLPNPNNCLCCFDPTDTRQLNCTTNFTIEK
ncbi:class I lanthipeptide [Chitinophaga solisilvae]|uniref:class I lanthipeptide n=1 Tax=Chitinophaga solisilvae TaxID=1233460 RepID=UPI0013680DF0|nr:class I lanthipeptide [Chitinophaga solisilvae]